MWYLIVSELAHPTLPLLPSLRARFRSKLFPFGTRLIPLGLSQLELTYFHLRYGWIGFKSGLVEPETWDDWNTMNEDDEGAYKNDNYENLE